MSSPIFRGMDRAALDRAYDNRGAIPDIDKLLGAMTERSHAFRAANARYLDITYGPHPQQRLDWFPASASRARSVVYVHGGYWQMFDKAMFAAVAEGPLACGLNVAMLEFGLAPELRLPQIVQHIREGIRYVVDHLARWNADPAGVVLVGHSAGAHLTARTLDAAGVRAGLAISGIYDLEPIRLSFLDERLQLTPDEVARESPLRTLPRSSPPLSLAVGADELPELIRQTNEFAEARRAAELPGDSIEVPHGNHFSILDQLVQRDGILCQRVVRLAQVDWPGANA